MTDRERLVELIKKSLMDNIGKSCLLAENIADYLIENSVVVLPCKIGQCFWRINLEYKTEQCHVSMLTQKSNGDFKIRISPLFGAAFEIEPNKIGKTVFLTREEAEKALKGVEKGRRNK